MGWSDHVMRDEWERCWIMAATWSLGLLPVLCRQLLKRQYCNDGGYLWCLWMDMGMNVGEVRDYSSLNIARWRVLPSQQIQELQYMVIFLIELIHHPHHASDVQSTSTCVVPVHTLLTHRIAASHFLIHLVFDSCHRTSSYRRPISLGSL